MIWEMLSLVVWASVVGTVFDQDELANSRVFNTPIATTVEEAVKQQIVEGLTLPKTYTTTLFSLGQPVVLSCATEVAATQVVGRSLSLHPLAEWSQAEVRALVYEACLRVPYSGWREHADEISDKTSLFWAEFQADDKLRWRRRVIATPFYKFVVLLNKGQPLVVYSSTTGMEEMSEELKKELSASYGMLKPLMLKLAEVGVEDPKETPCEAWFRSRLKVAKYHYSTIAHSDTKWPTAVHIHFATSSKEWSTIIGERSAAAPNGPELEDTVATALAQIVDIDQADSPKELFAAHEGETKKSAIYKNLAVLWSRKMVDGMERIELQFRCRSATIAGEAN